MRNKKILSIKLVNIHYHQRILLFALLLVISFQASAQSLSLQQCIDTAQLYNKNLMISRNNILISKQKHKEAISNLVPKITAIGDYRYFTDLPYQLMPLSMFNPTAPEGQYKESQFGVPHNVNAAINISVPLYSPQIYGGISTTKITEEMSELQNVRTEEQVFFDVSTLYYNVQILHYQLAFLDSNIINSALLLKNIQLLNQHSMAKETDVMQVELQLEQLKTERETTGNNIEQLLNSLKIAIGFPITNEIKIDTKIQFKEINVYSNSQTVDIQYNNLQNQLLKSELKTLKNSGLPSVALYGSYGQTGFGYDKKPNDFLKFFPSGFVGINLSLPLFNGTVTHRKVSQKKIEIQNNELQMSFMTDQLSMLIENATKRRGIAHKNIGNALSQIKLAETVYKQMLLQLKEGNASLNDVLLADNTLREAQQKHLLTIVEYLKADLELKKVTGNISFKN